jgi:hypothetical protein
VWGVAKSVLIFPGMQDIPLGIQVGIADPVVKIFDAFFISPEKFNTLCITTAGIIVNTVIIIDRFGLDEIIIFFIKISVRNMRSLVDFW